MCETPQQTVVMIEGRRSTLEPATRSGVRADLRPLRHLWAVAAYRVYRRWYWYRATELRVTSPPPAFTVGIFWGIGWGITASHWGWAAPVWHRAGSSIHITTTNNYFLNRPRYRDQWHDGGGTFARASQGCGVSRPRSARSLPRDKQCGDTSA